MLLYVLMIERSSKRFNIKISNYTLLKYEKPE